MKFRDNFARYVFDKNRHRPEAVAYIDQEKHLCYRELELRSRGFAAFLQGQGLCANDRVMLIHQDDCLLPTAILGCLVAGVSPVLVHSRCSRSYFQHCLDQCDPSLIFADATNIEMLSMVVKNSIPIKELSWELMSPSDHNICDHRADYWLFTSGTTGTPRAVIHDQHNLIHVGESYGINTDNMCEQDIVYSTAKLTFAYGICHSFASTLVSGSTAILSQKLPTVTNILDSIRRYRPTIFVTVPTVYAMLLGSDRDLDLIKIEKCVSAGEHLPSTLQQRWQERTGVPVFNLYGCTEFSGCVIANHRGDFEVGTVGHPVSGYHCELRDRNGNLAPLGSIGELWIQGPSLAKGYYNDSDILLDGWFRSRDLFFQTSEGRYVFQGRVGDLVKVRGQWVSPIEIETVALQNPAVQEIGVIGTTNHDGLTEITALIVARPNVAITEREISRYFYAHLDYHKCPRHIRLVTDLPRTVNGKLQRHLLRFEPA